MTNATQGLVCAGQAGATFVETEIIPLMGMDRHHVQQEGRSVACRDRGVWVVDGMSADMVLAGAEVILARRDLEIGPYSARHLASDIYAAMRLAASSKKAEVLEPEISERLA